MAKAAMDLGDIELIIHLYDYGDFTLVGSVFQKHGIIAAGCIRYYTGISSCYDTVKHSSYVHLFHNKFTDPDLCNEMEKIILPALYDLPGFK